MFKIPSRQWIANAAARFSGRHGAVTHQAHQVHCSRQSIYDHAQKVQAAVAAEYSGGPSREQLLQENQALRAENAQLWNWLAVTIEFPLVVQQQFSAVALGMGLSLTQIGILLALLLGAKAAPARSTIHRWAQAAGVAAGRVLRRIDAQCKALMLVGCLDEIFFHGRPVLVAVEPASMVWFIGTRAQALRGSTWEKQLRAWDALRYVVADAGVALQAGIALEQKRRLQEGGQPLDSSLDVFHTKREAHQALTIDWNAVERLCKVFDQAEAQRLKDQQQGIDARPAAQKATRAWAQVVQSFQHYEAIEAAWKQAERALAVFRPDGQLNDRTWAQAQVAAALPALVGRAWGRVRNHLQNPKSFSFLDRMHNQLAQLPMAQELREALVHLWWLRRQRPRQAVVGPVAGAGHVAYLVQQELCQKLDPNWRAWYREVAAVLRGVVRASSAAECMNSVLRMHQSRHRTMTPGMLDLKRLYWNTRVFRGGKRKGRSPYEPLGVTEAGAGFWGLIGAELSVARAVGEPKARRTAA